MASSLTRAILMNVGVFLADNNVRRNAGSYTFNYTTQTGNTVKDYVTVPAGGTYTWTTPTGMNPSLLTFVAVSSAVGASVTLRNATNYALTISQLHVVDDDVQEIVFTNSGLVPVRLELQQI